MKRLDLWITDKQAEAMANLIEDNEDLNKTRIVRNALDEYYEKFQDKENEENEE